MNVRAVVFVALCALPALAEGQTVELVYTPGALHQAVALKDALKVDVVHSSSALALVGAPADRKKAYGDKVTGVTAVVIVGEDALKAVADVEFDASVILVNANGPTAARGRVIRIFDGSVAIPPAAQQVANTGAIGDLLGTGKLVSLKGRPVEPIIQAILVSLAARPAPKALGSEPQDR
jgi:hypothetical protein